MPRGPRNRPTKNWAGQGRTEAITRETPPAITRRGSQKKKRVCGACVNVLLTPVFCSRQSGSLSPRCLGRLSHRQPDMRFGYVRYLPLHRHRQNKNEAKSKQARCDTQALQVRFYLLRYVVTIRRNG